MKVEWRNKIDLYIPLSEAELDAIFLRNASGGNNKWKDATVQYVYDPVTMSTVKRHVLKRRVRGAV